MIQILAGLASVFLLLWVFATSLAAFFIVFTVLLDFIMPAFLWLSAVVKS